MQMTKDKIVEMLRGQGEADKASRAERDLPDEIDLERDQGVLDELGLDPKELLQRFGGEGIPRLS
jgi:hypothetical protein